MAQDKKNTAIYVAYDDYLPHDSAYPERSLQLAILMTAMSDLNRPGESRRQAIEYLLSNEEDYIFSFRSICRFLEVDPEKILRYTGLRARQGENTHGNSGVR